MNQSVAVRIPAEAGRTGDDVELLARHIHRHWGLVIDQRRRHMLRARLQKRIRELGLVTLEDYADYLFRRGGLASEQSYLIDVVTTRTTSFFREAEHFRYISDVFLQELHASGRLGSQPLQMWSAACSIGQEAYTMAMTCEMAAQRYGPFAYRILATDIAQEAVNGTLHATYPEAHVENLSAAMKSAFLLRSKDRRSPRVRIAKALRDKVRAERLNLVDTAYPYPRNFDVIMLRNCLIYFDAPTQVRVLRQLAGHLREGGLLITGHSEPFEADAVGVECVRPSIYRRQ